MPPIPLNPGELTRALASLPGWRHERSALERTWRFPSFRAAMEFIHGSASEIDRLGHHPEWRNIYDQVSVRLTTHDAGCLVTAMDVTLAKLLDAHADRQLNPI